MEPIHKYPRTQHLQGSRLQPGDEDMTSVPVAALAGLHLVVEEKLDGANAALSFGSAGELRLQSRGHFLTGGRRERHFDLFKVWARTHRAALGERLGDRFVVYGEWLYARHTIFYDELPHYFIEFDVLDRHHGRFLTTPERESLLAGLPVRSAPVLATGSLAELGPLDRLVRRSIYRSSRWRERLVEAATGPSAEPGVDLERTLAQGDTTDLAEGLYIKAEGARGVEGRFKLVRASFSTAVLDSESHWLTRPIVPNRLAAHVDLFSAALQPDRGPEERR